MSYMRGETYVWTDGEGGLHIWSKRRGQHNDPPYKSSVVLTAEEFDELVAMRFAELRESGKLHEVLARAKSRWTGNGGCMALSRADSAQSNRGERPEE